MGRITIDQSHQIMAALATNTDWESIDFATLDLQEAVIRNAREAGRQFTAFLKNGGRVIISEPRVILIDRTTPFKPAEFFGEGWSIWRGPADGDGLTGDEEQDTRSTSLTEVDLTRVQFVTMLKPGEASIKGEEKLRRLKEAGHIRLDAGAFWHLWKNKHLIPESWKEKVNGNIRFIYFDGTVLRSPGGDRCVLCLYWDGSRWDWSYDWLGSDWSASDPSAVLASI